MPGRTPPPILPADTLPPPSLALRWTPRHTAGNWRFTATTDATVSLAGDTAGQNVPVHTTVAYSITLTGLEPPLTLVGRVDSVAVTSGSRIPAPLPGQSRVTSFQGVVGGNGGLSQLAAAPPDSATCPGGLDPVVAAAQALFVPTPPEVEVGSTWQDTVSTITCRERVPVATTIVQAYRLDTLTHRDGIPALAVERTSTITIRSVAADSARLTVTGDGSGTAMLFVDPATGMLLASHGTSSTTLTVLTVGASLSFTQQATVTVDRRP